ncbi:ABC transporter permease [Kutzneria sp. NPDC052558]|uniref:ABC transporter permease n=1 Tax=Kutzneria sp. NPDC052558 TaxID=3364121 RepID=UPI0037CA3499
MSASADSIATAVDRRAAVVAWWDRHLVVRRAVLVVCVLGAWELAAVLLDRSILPTLPEFAGAIGPTVASAVYWQALGATVLGWAVGLVAAAVVGIAIGLLIGLSDIADHATRVLIAVLYAVPPITVMPLLVIVYGTTAQMKIMIVFVAALWPLLIHAVDGVHEVDAVAKETARSYHLSRRRRVVFLYLPTASAFIATGLRIAASISLMLGVAVEVITGTPGLGAQIQLRSSNADEPASAFVYFVTAALLGLLVATVFRRIERQAMFWHPSFRRRPTDGRDGRA